MAKDKIELNEEKPQFFKLSDKVKRTGYKAVIDGATVEVLAQAYEYRWLENGARQVAGIEPARGIVRIGATKVSDTVDGFSNLTDEQVWQLANAGVIVLSKNPKRDHIDRFMKYLKSIVTNTTPTDY